MTAADKPTRLSLTAMLIAFAVAFLCALLACAPSIGKALHRADEGMAVLDVTITETADIYETAGQAAIHRCAEEIAGGTEAERHDCLEKQGFSPEQIAEVEAALAKLRDAYDMIADALGAIRQTLPALRTAQERAKAVLE